MAKRCLVKGVKRYTQQAQECAVATCASIASYYDKSLDYNYLRTLVDSRVHTQGMYSPEQGLLLNALGFKSVYIVTADLNIFDFSWQKHKRLWKIERLKRLRNYLNRKKEDTFLVSSYIHFLSASECNDVIIDWDFPKYIRKYIRKHIPVGASINTTSFYRDKKESTRGVGDIHGIQVEHAFVLRGYSDSHVYAIDSDPASKGYYKIKWPDFLLNINRGDLILVNQQCPNN